MTEQNHNDMKEQTASHDPEARIPANELYELLESWRWMQAAQSEYEGEAAEFARGYVMALDHAHADLNRVISNHE